MDYDEDYGDDYEETLELVRKVKQQLKLPKITDAQIIRKLEDTDYNVAKTVAFFKQKDAKATPNAKTGTAQTSAPKTKNTPAAPAKSVEVINKGTIKATSTESVTIGNIGSTSNAGADSAVVTSVFNVATTTKGELTLSDDEGISLRMGKLSCTESPQSHASATAAPAKAAAAAVDEEVDALTMVVTGHVDAGKSTLVGHLLYKCGQVAQRTMHKYEKDSRAIGKASFSLAWVTDESRAEREHGVTIDVAER